MNIGLQNLKQTMLNFWDDEVIEYAIEIKNEIISSLEKNSSKSDKIKVNYIKCIEKYIKLDLKIF